MSRFISRTSPEKLKRVKGLVRAGTYLAGLGLVIGGVQVANARAEVQDRTVELGRQMMQLAHATQHDVNKVLLNGQTMWLGTSLADDGVKNVLDRYESYCEKNAAQPASAWRALAGDAKADRDVDGSFLSAGILRGGDNKEGTVVCFTKTPTSKTSVTEALDAFSRTGNLGALGAVRYAYAKTTDKGNTLVLTAWTDDVFNVDRLMGEEGKDVPGAEFPEVPRVPGATRVLSARVAETPFGMNVYRGHGTPAEVVAFYDRTMDKAGWYGLDPEIEKRERPEDGSAPALGRLYEKDGLVLTLASKVEEGATFTALGLAGVTAGPGGLPGTGAGSALSVAGRKSARE